MVDINTGLPALKSQAEITEYVTARLRGDTQAAPPPVTDFRGVEKVEDTLVVWFRSASNSDNQRDYFWLAVSDLANTAWQESDALTLDRIAKVAYVLDTPRNLQDLPQIGPCSPDELKWGTTEEAQCVAAMLALLHRWELHSKEFWVRTLKTLAAQLGKQPELEIAVQQAAGALVDLDDLWVTLFLCALNIEPYPQDVLNEVLTDRWQRCDGIIEHELKLISMIGASLAIVRSADPDEYEKQLSEIKQLLNDWLKLPWQLETIKERNRLDFEIKRLRSSQFGSANNDVAQSNRQSPRSFIQTYRQMVN